MQTERLYINSRTGKDNLKTAAVRRQRGEAKVEVILFEDVKGLGRQGELAKVAEGYFRNYLKPKGLADEATPANRKRFEAMKKRELKLQAEKKAEALKLAKELEQATVTLRAKAGESDKLFGSITSHDIEQALAGAGFIVDKKQIELDEHIKKLGMFTVKIRIHPEVEGKLKLLVERA